MRLGAIQRQLTTPEIADFLARHPIVAARVAATKAALLFLDYEQLATPPAWYEITIDAGLIPPQGIEVDDTYGRVVVFPAANGEIYFTALADNSPLQPGVTNLPPYESPTPKGPGLPEVLDWAQTALFLIGGIFVLSALKK